MVLVFNMSQLMNDRIHNLLEAQELACWTIKRTYADAQPHRLSAEAHVELMEALKLIACTVFH